MRFAIAPGNASVKVADLSGACGKMGVVIQNITNQNVQFSPRNQDLNAARDDGSTGFLAEGFTLPDPKGQIATIVLVPYNDTLFARSPASNANVAIIDVTVFRLDNDA